MASRGRNAHERYRYFSSPPARSARRLFFLAPAVIPARSGLNFGQLVAWIGEHESQSRGLLRSVGHQPQGRQGMGVRVGCAHALDNQVEATDLSLLGLD